MGDLTADELNQFILSVSHLLDEDLPVVSRIHQMLCRLKTIIHAVDDLPENLLHQCVLENDSAHAQLERFAEDLSAAESSAISFFKLMNESVDQEKSRLEADTPVEESPEITSEEDVSGGDEVAQTPEALRQSTSTLPVEYVEEDSDEVTPEEPTESGASEEAEPVKSTEEEETATEDVETPAETEQQSDSDAEAQEAEKKRQQEEEERKRKEEEEQAEKERRRQEEREQMRREAQMRQRLREQAEAKAKKAEEEKNKSASSEQESLRIQRW